jgi:hypothetical protein
LSYSSNKYTSPNSPDEVGTTSGNFSISVGKAIRENAVFGLNMNYYPSTYTYNSGNGIYKNTMHIYGIGVFYRLYKNLGKEFYLFGEAGAGYLGSSSSTKDGLGNKILTGNSNGGQVNLYPGIAYKISKKFFIELSIPQLFAASYSTNKIDAEPNSTSKNDVLNINLNLNANPLTSLGIGFRLAL